MTINVHELLEGIGIGALALFTMKLFGEVVFWYSVNRLKGEQLLLAADKSRKV